VIWRFVRWLFATRLVRWSLEKLVDRAQAHSDEIVKRES
jgi:hypothetical protein